MVAVWLVSGLLTVCGGLGLFAYTGLHWLADGQWQPIALADLVAVPATRDLLGLNQLLELAFGLPIGVDLITVGLIALLVGRNLESWRALGRGRFTKRA
jgi:hypothetical protein